MSILLEFAIFPTDKGESASEYVSQVISYIRETGLPYRLTPMGTVIETNTMKQALDVIEKSYKILEPQASRVYCSAKFDIRKGKKNRLEQKIKSIEDKIGEVHR